MENTLIVQGKPMQDFIKELTISIANETAQQVIRCMNEDYNKNEKSSNSDYISRLQACEILRVSLPTIDKYLKEGIFQGYRIGRKIRLRLSEVNAALPKIMAIKYQR
jgi:excisionase family DNA binding protein